MTEPDREEVRLIEPEAMLRRLSVTLAGTDVEAGKATDVEAETGIDVDD